MLKLMVSTSVESDYYWSETAALWCDLQYVFAQNLHLQHNMSSTLRPQTQKNKHSSRLPPSRTSSMLVGDK